MADVQHCSGRQHYHLESHAHIENYVIDFSSSWGLPYATATMGARVTSASLIPIVV